MGITIRTALATIAMVGAACAGGAMAAPGPAPSALRTDLPLVVIDTDRRIVADPKVGARMRIIDAARGPNRLGRPANAYDGRIGIEIRGTSSSAYPKKQYSVETRTDTDENRSVPLLGLPKENDWILQGPYGDKTLMRNVVAYATARSLGAYASRTRFVEVVVNRDYRGVFVLMESLKLDKRRVAASDDDITGGYLLEMTLREKLKRGDRWFPSSTGQAIIHTDPEPREMGPARTRWIRSHLAAFEAALHGPAFTDPARGWRAHLDERSAVDMVLLNELFKNEDAFRSSLFMHKSSGEKLRLGPAWDFDIAMGNSDYGDSRSVEGWITTTRPWASRLLQDPSFRQALADRWRELRAGGLEARLMRRIDQGTRELGTAPARNFARWPILGTIVFPNPVDPATGRARTSFAAEVSFLRDWLTVRIAWIDANIDGPLR